MKRWIRLLLAAVTICTCLLASPMLAIAEPNSPPAVTGFSSLAKIMGREPSDPGFRLSELEVDITFDPSRRAMLAEYSARLELVDDVLRDIENWAFWPAEWVTEVTLGGVSVPVSQGITAPETESRHTLSLALGEAGSVVTRGSSSRLVIRTMGEIPEEVEVERYGIVLDLQQTITELCALCASGSDWTLRVTVPTNWSVISKGEPADVAMKGEGQTTSFAWIVPVSKMGANFMIIAGPYSRVALDLPGDVGLWFLQDDTVNRDELAAAVADVLSRANRDVAEAFGLPPIERLEIVKASTPGRDVSGKGPYGLVLLEYGRENRFSLKPFLQTLSHELMHQWFPGTAELDFTTGLWLSEGMATYFDARYVRCEWPPDEYFSNQKGYKPQPFSMDHLSANFATMPWVATMNGLYLKGAWIANALRATIGDVAFTRTIKRFYLSPSPVVRGMPEFQAIAEEESGLELTTFFEGWLGTAKTPSVSLENVTLSRAAGEWLVKGMIINRSPMPIPPVTVSIVRDGDPIEVTEVVLPYVAGQDSQQSGFEIRTPSLFVDVVLDRNYDILNISESGRHVLLILVWARQPWVFTVAGVASVLLFALVLLQIRRHSRRAMLQRQAESQQAVDEPSI